jgi:hypothetical protein
MNKLLLALMLALGVALVSTPAMARRGADDGHVHQCRGCDDPAGHVRGAEHTAGHEANERVVGHEANEHAAGHEANHERGHDRDDGPNHH